MSRHRSPRGRAHPAGAHRPPSLPVPLRGAAVAAVTGGALSLIAVTVPHLPAGEPAAALRLTADRGDKPDRGRPAIEPVRGDDDRFDAGKLVESVKRGEEAARRAVEQKKADDERADRERAERAARKATEDAAKARAQAGTGTTCAGLPTGGLGAVQPHVRQAAGFFGCRFGKPVMYGVAGRGGPSDHPGGLAVDFMVDRATGDALAQCALDNMRAMGVKYVIWRQRINFGTGWQPMPDRGDVTANHYDHVHVSFNAAAGAGGPRAC